MSRTPGRHFGSFSASARNANTSPGGRWTTVECSARGMRLLVRAGQVRDAAVRAGGPAGVRPCAVDGVEAAAVEARPGLTAVLADVAAGRADCDCGMPVHPCRTRPV